ncbi:Zinc finger, PHD-finger [Penicillium expansum]|uniref:Zinc finger, PHD-finger n=1 Tax=Penicillium expansum TaxID=27334 RepID=A0A0A2IXM9_PENEN|nr:Zinc finger, PHD-finger [Penicillium expansum]KGO44925.1 Zinc finger, PHD-finger [Penicillium expansum]KGO54922.1 Zinc finger, PHD-finger [Penicillium expansum]KGO70467.1 Zinc finger, PHD-finger [Penicillium expansum]
MRVSAAFMDLPAPDINPGRPQNVHEGNIFDHEGISEGIQPLSSHLEPVADNIPWESWESPAVPQEEAGWTTTGATETGHQNASTTLASNRTRSGRHITQPAARQAEPVVIKGRPVKAAAKKRKRLNRQVNIVCTGCYRGHSPSNNLIVLCDSCDAPWHQKCHNPNIDNEVIEIPEMNWFCIKCKPEQRQTAQTKSQKKTATKVKKVGRPKKQPVPESQVGGKYYSEQERRAYLSSLSHNSLVQLIVKVSNEWPSVPIFPPDIQPVTDFTPSLFPPHNHRASKPTPKKNSRSALLDWENLETRSENANAMDSNQRIGKSSDTTAPEATALDADQIFAAMVYDAAPDPAPPAALGGMTGDQIFAGISHTHPSTTAPQGSTKTTLQTPSRAARKFVSQAAPAAVRARKASFVSSNSDLLTDDESSYSQSRLQSPALSVSQSSHVGSQHESDYDPGDYRAYPEAGQGFQVPSTPSDLDIMAEDNNCLTFSHSIRGSAKEARNKKPYSPLGQRKQW